MYDTRAALKSKPCETHLSRKSAFFDGVMPIRAHFACSYSTPWLQAHGGSKNQLCLFLPTSSRIYRPHTVIKTSRNSATCLRLTTTKIIHIYKKMFPPNHPSRITSSLFLSNTMISMATYNKLLGIFRDDGDP